MQYKILTLIIIASLVTAINVGLAFSYQLSDLINSYQENIFMIAVFVFGFPLYVYYAHLAPRITSFFLFSLYMTMVGMLLVHLSPAWPFAAMVGALVAAALAGAAMLALAERQRARRFPADLIPPISTQRRLFYSGAAVFLAAGLSIPLLTLPPIVCAVLSLVGAIGIAAALTAIEHRRRGGPANEECRA